MRRMLLPLVVVLAGCSSQGGPTRPEPRVSVSAPAEVSAWFLADRDGQVWLAQELRLVPDDVRVPQAVVEQILEGPAVEGLTSPFPEGTRVQSVTLDGGVATVDWNARVLEAGVGAEAEAYGIQSVVYSLTELPEIQQVRFTVEGRDSGTASNGRTIQDWWGHVGLTKQPFTRDSTLRTFDASGT